MKIGRIFLIRDLTQTQPGLYISSLKVGSMALTRDYDAETLRLLCL